MSGLFLGRGFEPLVGFKVKDNYGVAFHLLLRGKVLSFCIFVAYVGHVGLLWAVHDLVDFWSWLDCKEMEKGQRYLYLCREQLPLLRNVSKHTRYEQALALMDGFLC